MKQRLDKALTERGIVSSRSQAENFIKLGSVMVDTTIVTKPGFLVSEHNQITLTG
jgi:predicted rRNA methylase YqxC with S4 and FtsJ domains